MICDKAKCTGCSACYNICPNKAIIMAEDKYGNIYPQIDKNKCIKCNLCKKVCPQLKDKLNLHPPITAYAMYSKQKDIRRNSTSGGAATTFYLHVLEQGGIVYGACNILDNKSFNFIRIDNKNDLYKVVGSKYVHCYINDAYLNVKKDLHNGKKVLFIGTPCQISGLKSYLMKEYNNLYTIDLICHGVASQKLLFNEISAKKINRDDVYYIKFRDEKMYNLKIYSKDKKILFEESSSTNLYLRNFLQGNIFRENCYNCKYAGRNRVSDITIGDFWGLDKKSKIYDDETKGISLILPNTQKGMELMKKITDKAIIEERTVDEACQHNMQLNSPMTPTRKYSIYVNSYPKLGYKKTMAKMTSLNDRIKAFLKSREKLYSIYKKLK